MSTARRPELPPGWRIARHCKHCRWHVVYRLTRMMAVCRTYEDAAAFVVEHSDRGASR